MIRRRHTAILWSVAVSATLLAIGSADAQTPIPTFGICNVAIQAAPIAAASGDFNRDGTPDVALVDASAAQVVVLLLNRNQFAAGNCAAAVSRSTVSLSSNAVNIAAGDIEGNGSIDLAVALQTGVLLLRNDGTGQFDPDSAVINVGVDPRAVVLTDINADGRTDIIVGNGNTNRVTIAYGTATGFDMPVDLAANGPVTNLVVMDLDQDFFSDIAALSSGSGVLSVYLQNPASPRPTFRALSPVAVGVAPSALGLGDFNDDGVPDFAITSGGTAGVLNVFLSQLPGNEQVPYVLGPEAEALATLGRPVSIGVADFNRDFFRDVAVANQGESTVSFFLGNSQAALREVEGPCAAAQQDRVTHRCLVGSSPRSLVLGDVDGDGRTDVITGNQGAGSISVLLSSNPPAPATATATATSTALATSTPTPSATPTSGGPCGTPHAGPGCDNPACQNCVCSTDPPCCQTAWDQSCADRVAPGGDCADACGPTPSPRPTGSPTLTGPPTLTPTPTVTSTGSVPPTVTETPTVTQTPTGSPQSPTRTRIATQTPTLTPTSTRTERPTNTAGPTESPTPQCFTGGICVSGPSCAIVEPGRVRTPGWAWSGLNVMWLGFLVWRRRRQ